MALKRDLDKFLDDLERQVKSSTDKKSLRLLGKFVLDMIKDRTRKGFGVPGPNKRQQKLKPLSSAYIEQRRRIRLSQFTSPGKSNLTRSGRMLGGLRVTTKRNSLVILPTGDSREGIPNSKVAEFVSKARPFLFLSNKELDRVIQFFDQKILSRRVK